jgi:hypothetical protein
MSSPGPRRLVLGAVQVAIVAVWVRWVIAPFVLAFTAGYKLGKAKARQEASCHDGGSREPEGSTSAGSRVAGKPDGSL